MKNSLSGAYVRMRSGGRIRAMEAEGHCSHQLFVAFERRRGREIEIEDASGDAATGSESQKSAER